MYSWVKLSHIAKWCEFDGQVPDLSVTSISTDTRTLRPGDLFLALNGPNFDGNRFLQEAVNHGASAIIASKKFSAEVPVIQVKDTLQALVAIASELRSAFTGKVIAITGSAGKSSTKEMTAKLLGPNTVCSPASFNNIIGVSKTLCLLEDNTKYLVLEMGMNALGEIKTLCDHFRPQVGVITNIGDAHLGKVGGKKGVYKAKKELFDFLSENSKGVLGVALNKNDSSVVRAFDEAFPNGCITLSYSAGVEKESSDVAIAKAEINAQTSALELEIRVGKDMPFSVSLPIFGLHHAENIGASIAVAKLMQTPLAEIKLRLKAIRPASHRGKVLSLPGNKTLIDESYNSNPKALRASLKSLSQTDRSRRKLIVVGDMLELGEFSKLRHEEVGKDLLSLMKDHEYKVLAVGEEMRHLTSILDPSLAFHVETLGDAESWMKAQAKPGDIIFLKGSRGIELDKLIKPLLS